MINDKSGDVTKESGATKALIEKIQNGLKAGEKESKKMKDYKGQDFKDPSVMSEVYAVFLKEY